MAARSGELRVPSALCGQVGRIFEITDRFSAEHLDAEYASLCCSLVAKLARKRRSPLVRGDLQIWAAGAIGVVGANNFVFGPSQTPHLTADQLSEPLGIPKSAMAAKAKRIRDLVGLTAAMDVEFCRRELLEDHPYAWLIEVNGMIVDARWLSAELQDEALQRGLIPDLPRDQAA
jgi:hypothetical protein